MERRDVKVGARFCDVATGAVLRVTRIGEHQMEVDLVDEATGRRVPFVPMYQLVDEARYEPR